MNCYLSNMRVGWFVLALGLLVFGTERGSTQQLKTKDGLNKPFVETATRRNKLMTGEEKYPTVEDRKVAEIAAQYYIYRIQLKITDNPSLEWHNHLVSVQTAFAADVKAAMDRKENNRAFLNMMGPPLVASMKDVLSLDIQKNATVVVNACMMLPTMAKLKQDHITDYLCSLVNDEKQHDVIRLYAVKALKEYMPIRPFEEDEFDLKSSAARKIRDLRSVDALTKFIERPAKAELPPEELAAVRYLRREAIMSLAHAGLPAVAVAKKNQVIEGAIAPTLLQVLAAGIPEPAPSLQEKIEAALGLCSMKYTNMPEYQPDVAIYFIGQTLYEFVTEYNKDLSNFAVKGPMKIMPMIAWKVESKRFEAGLKDLAIYAKGSSARMKAEDLETRAKPLLLSISKYDPTDNEKIAELVKMVRFIKPKAGAIFKTPNAPAIAIP